MKTWTIAYDIRTSRRSPWGSKKWSSFRAVSDYTFQQVYSRVRNALHAFQYVQDSVWSISNDPHGLERLRWALCSLHRLREHFRNLELIKPDGVTVDLLTYSGQWTDLLNGDNSNTSRFKVGDTFIDPNLNCPATVTEVVLDPHTGEFVVHATIAVRHLESLLLQGTVTLPAG